MNYFLSGGLARFANLGVFGSSPGNKPKSLSKRRRCSREGEKTTRTAAPFLPPRLLPPAEQCPAQGQQGGHCLLVRWPQREWRPGPRLSSPSCHEPCSADVPHSWAVACPADSQGLCHCEYLQDSPIPGSCSAGSTGSPDFPQPYHQPSLQGPIFTYPLIHRTFLAFGSHGSGSGMAGTITISASWCHLLLIGAVIASQKV